MWVLYAVLGAFAKALTSVIRKKIAHTNSAIYIFISTGLITLALVTISSLIPSESLDSVQFGWWPLLVSGLIQIIAFRANMYAFRHEELSYITPMFALTPLYATVISFIVLGESPSVSGLLGILLIVAGVYAVTSTKGIGAVETIRRLAINKGARAGMVVPLTYALSATFNKEALNQGVTPLVSVAVISAVMCIGHVYVLTRYRREVVQTVMNKPLFRTILLASLFGIGSVGFASLALEDAFTSYTLSIRRLDVLITVLIGWKFMGDSNFARRITGALIMTVGVVFVSFG